MAAERILVVDDGEANRYIVRKTLEPAGYSIEEAVTGADAIKGSLAQPDLIILDVHLPDINGFEVCRRIKENPETKTIPVLHLSAEFYEDVHKVAGLEGGADSYLTLPVNPSVLLATVKALLRIRGVEQELRIVQKQLEERVTERTAEVTHANEQLSLLNDELTHRAKELLRSNQELEQFAYAASHDLQEPVRKIITFGNRLEQKHSEGMSNEAKDLVTRMSKAAVRMQTLIQDLLEYSRINIDDRPWEKTDLNKIISGVRQDLDEQIRKSGADIVQDPLPTLEAHQIQMRQLFLNLMENAIKFRSPERPLKIEIRCSEDSANWKIEIKDNGIGFDDKYRDRIFTIFQRLHPIGEYDGTGIGLALCRKILERHGGTLDVISAPDQGSTFTIYIPRRQDPAR